VIEVSESFVFYRSYFDSMMLLPEKFRPKFIEMLVKYALDGVEPDFSSLPQSVSPLFQMAMANARPNLDATARRSAANIANGKKGGNPNFQKGKKNPYYGGEKITQDNPEITDTLPRDNREITERLPTDNLNVNEKVYANANIPFSFTNEKGCVLSDGAVGVSTAPPPKQGGLTEEEIEIARKLMPIYE
jgi:hypothetical protein